MGSWAAVACLKYGFRTNGRTLPFTHINDSICVDAT
jgi:hypothetical protein